MTEKNKTQPDAEFYANQAREILEQTGQQIGYWVLVGRMSCDLTSLAERAVKGDSAGAQIAFTEFRESLKFDYAADPTLRRLVLICGALINVIRDGEIAENAISQSATRH